MHVDGWRAAYRGLVPDALLDELSVAASTLRWRARLARPRGESFVAERAGAEAARVVGFGGLADSRDADARPGATGEITALYVHPEEWRGGAGRALAAAMLARAAERGHAEVTLWVLAGNARAFAFYEALGFRADGAERVDRARVDAPLHELRYRRRLA